MAWKVCIVCQDVAAFGPAVDKRIVKTTCSEFCKSVLMDWATRPDPRPGLRTMYLDALRPESVPHMGDGDEDGEEGSYEGDF